jgi:hypothetical protein
MSNQKRIGLEETIKAYAGCSRIISTIQIGQISHSYVATPDMALDLSVGTHGRAERGPREGAAGLFRGENYFPRVLMAAPVFGASGPGGVSPLAGRG